MHGITTKIDRIAFMEQEILIVLGGESCSSCREPEGESRVIIYQCMERITHKNTDLKVRVFVPELFK